MDGYLSQTKEEHEHMHIIFQNCPGLFENISLVIIPQASADTDPQVTIEDRGTFLLDKSINLAFILSKF